MKQALSLSQYIIYSHIINTKTNFMIQQNTIEYIIFFQIVHFNNFVNWLQTWISMETRGSKTYTSILKQVFVKSSVLRSCYGCDLLNVLVHEIGQETLPCQASGP